MNGFYKENLIWMFLFYCFLRNPVKVDKIISVLEYVEKKANVKVSPNNLHQITKSRFALSFFTRLIKFPPFDHFKLQKSFHFNISISNAQQSLLMSQSKFAIVV